MRRRHLRCCPPQVVGKDGRKRLANYDQSSLHSSSVRCRWFTGPCSRLEGKNFPVLVQKSFWPNSPFLGPRLGCRACPFGRRVAIPPVSDMSDARFSRFLSPCVANLARRQRPGRGRGRAGAAADLCRSSGGAHGRGGGHGRGVGRGGGVHDVGRGEDGTYFLVMKHLEGESLEELINKLRAGVFSIRII